MPASSTVSASDGETAGVRPELLADQVEEVVASLRRLATQETLAGMARYAIPSERAFGVAVGDLQKLAKRLGRNHDLASALWASGWYEARMLAAFVDDPAAVTPEQMDCWCGDFDSWAICDTVCFHLFDRSPYAWDKVHAWAAGPDEFVKRGAFALLACLALHDKAAADERFLQCLDLLETAALDERNFVKKSVNWALRAVGGRNAALNAAAIQVAQRLSTSALAAPRWVGKDALRQLTSPAAIQRLARSSRAAEGSPDD